MSENKIIRDVAINAAIDLWSKQPQGGNEGAKVGEVAGKIGGAVTGNPFMPLAGELTGKAIDKLHDATIEAAKHYGQARRTGLLDAVLDKIKK